ncbi:Neuropeptide Y receptor [Trichoplax sp. H2]|nr:Neuropeptide Y receptor [Trichoplax sp. H2]|eukprot:RDD37893.1 Neuropeptide Y receptor [Trichoplax sp. H2]
MLTTIHRTLRTISNHFNQTENSTTNQFALRKYRALQIILPISIIIAVLGTIANSLICYAIVKKKELHTPTCYLMINMAISDCLTVIMTALINTIHYYLACYIAFSSFLVFTCKITYFVNAIAYISSTVTLVAISLERHSKISPLSMQKSSFFNNTFKLKAAIAFTWIAGIVIAIPYLTLVSIVPQNPWICSINYITPTFNIPYFISLFILVFIVPNIIIIAMYSRIIRYLNQNNAAQRNQPSFQRIFKHKRKMHCDTIKMLILVTAGYMITSLPIFIAYIMIAFSGLNLVDYIIHLNDMQTSVAQIAYIILPLACCQNPLIYLYYNKAIRNALSSQIRRLYNRLTAKVDINNNRKYPKSHKILKVAEVGQTEMKPINVK